MYEFGDKVLVLRGDLAIDEIESALDFAVQHRSIVILEGQFGHHHCKQYNS
jgi:hypothetical protein